MSLPRPTLLPALLSLALNHFLRPLSGALCPQEQIKMKAPQMHSPLLSFATVLPFLPQGTHRWVGRHLHFPTMCNRKHLSRRPAATPSLAVPSPGPLTFSKHGARVT